MDWNLEEAIAYYKRQGAPGDQSALTALLREVQQEHAGGIPRYMAARIAEGLGTPESLVLALIRRIPSLRLLDSHCLEICAGANCPRRRDLAGFVERTYGTNPEAFTLRYVPCMRRCGKGPNIRWDGVVYTGVDEALLKTLIGE